MKKTYKSIVSMLIAAAMGCTMLSSYVASAEPTEATDSEEQFGQGLIPESDEEYYAFAAEFGNDNEDTGISAYATLPSSVDLSTSPCFPPIGNQGGIGSCTAWASTYYQYSYEVNKLNGVTSTANRVVYSPKWTYNNINGGKDNGSSYTTAYKLLKNQGALTNTQFPYPSNASSSNYNVQELPTYSSAVADMRNALNTRLTSYGNYTISGSGTAITSNTDTDLNAVKTALNNGKVLTISTWNDFNWKYGSGSWSSTKLAYRCDNSKSGSHAMTVVGYNDNVTCDINGDGKISAGEKGAFKIINSWGASNTGANNAGVIWVMYDALNGVSCNNLDESAFSSARKPALGTGSNNIFNYIQVDYIDVAMVAEVSFTTQYRNQVKIQLGRCVGTSAATWITAYDGYSGSNSTLLPYTGTMVFDYASLANPISQYHTGYNWRINLTDTYADGNAITDLKMKITDGLGNVMRNLEDGEWEWNLDGSSYAPLGRIWLSKGDLDLNFQVNTSDITMLQNYLLNRKTLSYLQFFLADMNNDGYVDSFDLTALRQQVNG